MLKLFNDRVLLFVAVTALLLSIVPIALNGVARRAHERAWRRVTLHDVDSVLARIRLHFDSGGRCPASRDRDAVRAFSEVVCVVGEDLDHNRVIWLDASGQRVLSNAEGGTKRFVDIFGNPYVWVAEERKDASKCVCNVAFYSVGPDGVDQKLGRGSDDTGRTESFWCK